MTREFYDDSLLLFVGEGNFSFSSALSSSTKFSSLNYHQLIATDYIPDLKNELTIENNTTEREESRRTNFSITALKDNVKTLKSNGHLVLYDVDAIGLHEHIDILYLLKNASAAKIFVIFNFPHVKSKKMKIGLNRDLLRNFFISCDKLTHCLNENSQKTGEGNSSKSSCFPVNVIPVVSLCAGQSGIAEVESLSRSWGDSWQINDMAAHGNFVCTSICKFTEWYLNSLISSNEESDNRSNFTYQSSYYRLQTGTSFVTEKALTFTYEHTRHIDPSETNRLKSILRFTSQYDDKSEDNEVTKDFISCFGPLSNEKVIFSSQDEDQLPYNHVVHCEKEPKKVGIYISKPPGENEQLVKTSTDVVGKEVKVQVKSKENDAVQVVTVGKLCDDDDTYNTNLMTLYVDKLIELKYNCSYRLAVCNNVMVNGKVVQKSLYPHIHEFHISFWVLDNQEQRDKQRFTRNSFLEVVLDVYGLMLKAVEFVEEYLDHHNHRRSLCWKVQVQSLESALSRLTAHQMYLQLRKELTYRLHVEVR